MTNNIVNVNVTQTQAPIPSTLQQTGAFISVGGTTKAAGSLTLLTAKSSLAPILATGLAITSLAWATGLVTATLPAAHGITIGDTFEIVIAGAIPTAYNGIYTATATGTTAFTYPLASNPGTETTPGTWAPGSVAELVAMNNTFWGQGSNTAVYVLELGETDIVSAITALGTWLTNNPKTVYALVVPRAWDALASFLSLTAQYEATTAELYFFTTTTNSTYTQYTAQQKAVYAMIESPGVIPATEFSVAAHFWNYISQRPSNTNKNAQMAFRFLFGVTPYPVPGNGALFAAWKTASVNWNGTGYEGGIATTIIFYGHTMDGKPINYWYAVDWLQTNIDLNISNAVINGSNDPINPLALNQQGIDRLQAVGANTLSSGISFGLLLGQVVQTELDGPSFAAALDAGQFAGQAVINAVPFVAYYTANPSDYAANTYNGYSITCTPLRGFESITFNLNITDFVA